MRTLFALVPAEGSRALACPGMTWHQRLMVPLYQKNTEKSYFYNNIFDYQGTNLYCKRIKAF